MAVELTDTTANFVGTGVSSTYAAPIYANDDDQIGVYVNGLKKTLGDDYVLNGLGSATGISIVATFAFGATIYVERATPVKQEVDTQNNETILEDVLDGALDKLTMMVQERAGETLRALRVPRGEEGSTIPVLAQRIGRFLAFDAEGDAFASAGTGNDSALRTDLAAAGGAALAGFTASGAGAQQRSLLAKSRDWVSVRDYMTPSQNAAADAGTYPDCTTAFLAAQTASKHVRVPPGTYGLTGLRILNSRWLIGSGRDNCFLKQLDPTIPAINCLSDVSVGQLKGVRIAGFYVLGADDYATRGGGSSPVPGGKSAVIVAGYGAYAVWDSHFSYFAKNTLTAIEVQGADAANVFESEFHITSEGTRYIAAILNGGAYNRTVMFLTQCDNFAITCSFGGSTIRTISENCQFYSGQQSIIHAEVEGIAATFLPATAVIIDQGFYNVYVKPCCNLLPVDAGRVSYAFSMFYGSVMIAPQILQVKPTWPLLPNIFPSTILGGVRGACAGKIEGNHSVYQQQILTIVGDAPDWTTRRAHDRQTQYLAPSAPFNLQVNVLVDNVVLNPSVAINPVNISFVQYQYPGAYPGDGSTEGAAFQDGMQFTFSTTQDLSGIGWGAAGSLLPTSINANTSLSIVYSAGSGKFHVA